LHWLLLLEEYGVTFEFLPGKNFFESFADALSRLDFDILRIHHKEVLSLLSGPENNNISNIKLTMMHTALIQSTNNIQGNKIKKKGLSPTLLLNTAY
jgi:hypothetical protein